MSSLLGGPASLSPIMLAPPALAIVPPLLSSSFTIRNMTEADVVAAVSCAEDGVSLSCAPAYSSLFAEGLRSPRRGSLLSRLISNYVRFSQG